MAEPSQQDEQVGALIRRVRELELIAAKNASGFFAGNYVQSMRGGGMVFHEARKYVAGESIRMIDWNITARMNEPYVKTFLDEREREVFIALDVSPSMHTGWQERTKLEYAVEVAATLAVSATTARDRLGFLTFSDRIHEISRPIRARHQLFRALKTWLGHIDQGPTPADESDPRLAIHAVQQFRGKRLVVFLISDFVDHDIPDDLRYVQAKHDVSLIHIYDPIEYTDTGAVFFAAVSPEKGRLPARARPGWAGSLDRFRRFLAEEGGKYRALSASLSTRDPIDRSLMEFFHRKQRRIR